MKYFFIFLSILLVSCSQPKTDAMAPAKPVRNIILIIGDGMGPSQLGLLETYAQRAPQSIYRGRPTAISAFAHAGHTFISDPAPFDALVVDSACSATQLAIGEPSRSEMIGLNAEGHAVETLLQLAKRHGKVTGLVSDTRITHATPAAFAAHQAHRKYENEIAVDLITNKVDLMLSGGLRYFLPNNAAISSSLRERIEAAQLPLVSRRNDGRNVLSEAKTAGYQLAFNKTQLQTITQLPVLGLFQSSSIPDALLEKNTPSRGYPSLTEMTHKALQLLDQHEQGFVLMVEGGQIDWAAHNNDAGGLLHEMLRIDEAVQVVFDWVKDRDDTLVVITADHETGGFGFSYSGANVPAPQSLPGVAFAEQPFKPDFNFGSLTILDQLYQQQKGFYTLWRDAAAQATAAHPSAEQLQNAVAEFTPFTLTIEQAQAVLTHSNNRYFVAGHSALGSHSTPHVHDFPAFYVYGEDVHLNLLGRALSEQQNVVWSTGTHTSTPVPVIVYGPTSATSHFRGFLTHPQIGSILKQVAAQ